MRADSQRGRDLASPEVSRTFHAGSAGAHVDGFEQQLYYGRMMMTSDPDVKLENLTRWVEWVRWVGGGGER